MNQVLYYVGLFAGSMAIGAGVTTSFPDDPALGVTLALIGGFLFGVGWFFTMSPRLK